MVAKRYKFGRVNVDWSMTSDNRDYSIDKIRKATGYVEKADFRVPMHELHRRKKAAKMKRPSSFWIWFTIAAVFMYYAAKIVIALLKR